MATAVSPSLHRTLRRAFLAGCSPAVLLAGLAMAGDAAAQVKSVTVGGSTFVDQGLVGVGRLASTTRDKYGETLGSMSALTFDARSWRRQGDTYTGLMFALPDRGYNAAGTTDYRPRFNTLGITFTPYYGNAALPAGAGRQNQVGIGVVDTTLFTESNGTPLSGLDPVSGKSVRPAANGFPELPQAINGKISLDPEGIARLGDGSFYVSDEYGPYIYRFAADGRLLSAVRPPEALIPIRNGVTDFASNNPGPGAPTPSPADPTRGRQNNQGLEGLSLTPDKGKLAALLQSATRQDGGTGGNSATRDKTRLVIYDVAGNPNSPTLIGHYVVQLPRFQSGSRTLVAAQSEMLALNDKQFLVLSRDSNNGQGLGGTNSLYRGIDLIDISNATNLVGTPYNGTTPVAPGGALAASVTPVSFTSFINLNDNAQLGKFGLHNGGANDANLLSEKWEAMGVVPTLDPNRPDDVFLFVGNDNDFMTRNGFQVGQPYDAGANVDTMLLVYRLTLPTYVDPLAVESLRETALPLARALGDAGIQTAEATARTLRNHLSGLRFLAPAPAAGGGMPAVNGWVGGRLDFARVDGDSLTPESKPHSRNAMIGADVPLAEGLVAGLSVGGAWNRVSVDGLGGAKLRSTSVSPYIAGAAQGFFGAASFTYSWDDYGRIVRDTGAYGLTARGDTKGRSWSAGAEGGYDFGTGAWSYGPVAGARYTRVTIDGYTEGEAIHMNGILPSQTLSGWTWELGGQLAHRFDLGAHRVTPQVRLGYEWNRVRGDGVLSATLANRTAGSLGTVTRAFSTDDRDGVRFGTGVTVEVGNLSWQIAYDGKYGRDARDHAVFTSLGYRF